MSPSQISLPTNCPNETLTPAQGAVGLLPRHRVWLVVGYLAKIIMIGKDAAHSTRIQFASLDQLPAEGRLDVVMPPPTLRISRYDPGDNQAATAA